MQDRLNWISFSFELLEQILLFILTIVNLAVHEFLGSQ